MESSLIHKGLGTTRPSRLRFVNPFHPLASTATPMSSPSPVERLNAAVQRLEAALEVRDKTETVLKGETDAAVKRAEKAEAELATLKTDYAALSAIADQVEKRLDKAIERLKSSV